MEDIEKLYNEYDARMIPVLINEVRKQNDIDRLLQQLDIAEAFNVAYVGSTGQRKGKEYHNWRTKKMNAIYKILGMKQATIWDNLHKSMKLGK